MFFLIIAYIGKQKGYFFKDGCAEEIRGSFTPANMIHGDDSFIYLRELVFV